MRRVFIVAVFSLLTAAAVPPAGACQYCRQGADPEAYRFMNEGRISGSFPVDPGMGSYAEAAAPAPAALTAAPPASALVTTAAALPAAPRRSVPAVPPPPAAAAALAGSTSAVRPGNGLSGHWADFGLLGLLSLGGMFVWRTRRSTVVPAA